MNIHFNDTITRAIICCNNSLKNPIVESTTKSILSPGNYSNVFMKDKTSSNEQYDGYGAARYIIVVVLVYGLGIGKQNILYLL